MSTKKKILKIEIPFTLQEYRKGSRYILTKLTTSEVQIVYHRKSEENGNKSIATHKVMNVQKKVPYVIRKLIPDDACVVDEFSTHMEIYKVVTEDNEIKNVKKIDARAVNAEGELAAVDVRKISVTSLDESKKDEEDNGSMHSGTTYYKNRYFDEKTFSLYIKTLATKKARENPFELEEPLKIDSLDFRTAGKRELMSAGDRDYSGDWQKNYPVSILYKSLEVSVNKFGMGWIAGEIEKHLQNMLLDVQKQIIESYDEWKDLSEEDLCKMEEDMIERFLIKMEEKK
ncbi:hypothetical protein ENBRE01_0888 [Enteropsectra breve]|nr:hypothetical protein ENBRE01_0888 [Enteropsectra breve]